jgi:hypothetical protein
MKSLFAVASVSLMCAAGNVSAIAKEDANHHELNIKQYSNKSCHCRK